MEKKERQNERFCPFQKIKIHVKKRKRIQTKKKEKKQTNKIKKASLFIGIKEVRQKNRGKGVLFLVSKIKKQ